MWTVSVINLSTVDDTRLKGPLTLAEGAETSKQQWRRRESNSAEAMARILKTRNGIAKMCKFRFQ